ncbi:tetratricopeptide repeat protein [Aerosakkonema funiforme]|uniref:tetratricopeptide repeat protein n=1 Tax=Aerosakkonema funiforme TaxID=1246630 RepID=UPI0035BA5579
MPRKQLKLQLSLPPLLFFSVLCVGITYPGIAADNNNNNNNNKKPNPNQFPPNPLEIRVRDPLLPRSGRDKRPLTQAELATLATALDRLNAEAAAKLQANDEKGALETWYRELRLRRYLGLLPEVQALSRVGGIAWERNLSEDVQYITKRLQTIQQTQLKPPVELDLLRSLATAFEQVRAPDWSVKVYEQILAEMRQQGNKVQEEALLLKIGELSLSWFDYAKAIGAYQELVNFAQQAGDRTKQVNYLKQLAYLYGKDNQIEKSIKIKQQLIEFYRNQQDFVQIPAMQLEIGSAYEAVGRLEQATQNYQEAYAFAWSIQQYASAGDALRKLVAIQRAQKQINAALETYQVLVKADYLAYNFYGMMNTYDEVGQLYLEYKNFAQALSAFQKGLELAQQLKHRESYFARQIQRVTEQANR